MNERDVSIIKAVSEEFGLMLNEMREAFAQDLAVQRNSFETQLSLLAGQLEELQAVPVPDVDALVEKAVAALPAPELPSLPDIPGMISQAVSALPKPQDGKSVTEEDVRPMLQAMVDSAFSAVPAPKNGKDYDPEVMKQAINDAVSQAVSALPKPQDGKSVTEEDVRPMLQAMVDKAIMSMPDIKTLVSEAVSALPVPEPGKPGEDGRDALALELLPAIDEAKNYPRGTYATHNGGLWRAYEKTAGMRGWECLVDGIATVDITNDEQRTFAVTIRRSSGACETKSFGIPVMIYRGVFKAEESYQPGDTVTWGGSLWHCDEATTDKPGETGSKGWTLAAKRGRDGRDKA